MKTQIQMEFFSVCVFVVGCFGLTEAAYKRWVPNTNFNNPNNWNAGRLPCKNDHVQFPESIPPVYVQSNSSMVELVLPNNGELVLGSYVSFSFPVSQDFDPSCRGQDIQFIRLDPESWFNSSNWCEVTDPKGACMSEQPGHLEPEKLPCDTDDVIFPKGSTFLVDLDTGVDLYMASLAIDGKWYTTGTMRTYLDSTEGQQQFKRASGARPTTINIQGGPCSSIDGCMCGNDKGEILKRVCDKEESRCGNPSCENPLQPDGGCCKICGAIMTAVYGMGFNMKSFQTMINSNIPRENRDDVKVIISKISSEKVQVVLLDQGMSANAYGIGMDIKSKLEDDASGGKKYGISTVSLQGTGAESPNSPSRQTDTKAMGAGSIVSIILGILGLLAFIGLAMYCLVDRREPSKSPRRWPWMQWGPFRRMSGAGEMELQDATSVAYNDNVSFYGEASGSNGASTNGSGHGSRPTFNIRAMRTDSSSGFSNPLYTDPQPFSRAMYIRKRAPSDSESDSVDDDVVVMDSGLPDDPDLTIVMDTGLPPDTPPTNTSDSKPASAPLDDGNDASFQTVDLSDHPSGARASANGRQQNGTKGTQNDRGFTNPLYGQEAPTPIFVDASLKLNPVFTQEGIEEDSLI